MGTKESKQNQGIIDDILTILILLVGVAFFVGIGFVFSWAAAEASEQHWEGHHARVKAAKTECESIWEKAKCDEDY